MDKSLAALADDDALREKYGDSGKAPVIFAIGDGNHSLAAARLCWEQKREQLTPAQRESDPARFALVELVNIHEKALDFEPIHRVLFDTDTSAFAQEYEAFRVACDPDLTVGQYIGAAEEFCQNYLRKGTKILLEGQLQSRSYEAQDGSKRYVTEVNTLDIEFAESKKDTTQQAGAIQGTAVDDIPF